METTNIAMLGIVNEELTEDNYEYWKVCLERYLISQGLWDVVSGMKARPEENADDYEDWRRKNALALHAIQLSCGPHMFYKFRKTTSAKVAWEHLAPSHLTRPAVEEREISLFRELVSSLSKIFVPDLYHRKLLHHEALKILGFICKEIPKLSEFQLKEIGIDEMIHDAVKLGIFEFIDELIKCDPSIIWRKDSKGRTIFAHAIVLRQAKIFSLIREFGTKKSIMAHRHDIFGNNYLHLAAKLSPPTQLEHVSGAALQMQKEIQWFKEVETMVQPKCREEINEKNTTPSVLFTEEHKELVKDGERWMKSTAASGMVVGTLIAAVMFTTAFTVPGGNDEKTGLPIFLKYNEFLIFVASNALSMFFSSTSVLMFLGILTARYEEKDFYRSLPTKVIMGLSCLFLSIVTMMVAFGAAIYMTVHNRLAWVTVPMIVLIVIPIALSSVLQFPLLLQIIYHTYVSSIYSN